jgi:membrane-associated phospholipid phosphatase
VTATGGIFPLSGHAGVAAALGAATLPHLSPAGRAAALGIMSAVALSRVYVGAHLPLDIAGGIAVDAAVALPAGRLTADGLISRRDRPGRRWR